MGLKQKTAKAAVVALAAAGAVTAAAAPAAAAEFNSCDLSVKLRELRGWDANDQYNIVVWKESARASSHFNGIALQGHTFTGECDNFWGKQSHYFWMVFRDGEFTHQGDGGYRNWAYSGLVVRNGGHVRFFPR